VATRNKHPGSEYHRKAAAHHAADLHHHLEVAYHHETDEPEAAKKHSEAAQRARSQAHNR
jgi:hypothetical protein